MTNSIPSLGETMSAASKAVLDKPGLYLSIWAVTGLPALLLLAFAERALGVQGGEGFKALADAGHWGSIAGFIGVAAAAKLLELAGLTAVIIAAAVRRRGGEAEMGEVFETALGRLPGVLWTSIVVGLRILLGLLLLVIPGLILAVRYAFAHLAATLEGKTGGAAAGRSAELMSGRWGLVLGYSLVLALVALVVSGVVGVTGAVAGKLSGVPLVFSAAASGVNSLASAWAAAGSVVLFLAIVDEEARPKVPPPAA